MTVLKRVNMSAFSGKENQGITTAFETELYIQQDTPRLGSWIYAKLMDPDGLIEDKEEVIQSKLYSPQGILPVLQRLPNMSLDITVLTQINMFDLYDYLIGFLYC